jgi:D-glycero-alpha-D-manno-heptose 1-phosphate guanylyltransferase
MLSQTTAVILAGGLGTRLLPVVADRPKVLAEIHGRPFVSYLLDQLAAVGLRHVVLCTGFRAELVQSTLGPSYRGMELHYSPEETALGTGGALRSCSPLLRSDPVLVLNGDSYCEVDLRQFWSFHHAGNAKASLVLTQVADCSRFGKVCTDAEDRISSFEEKGAVSSPGWINAGIYLLCREWLDKIASNRPISLEREVFPRWTGPEFFAFRGGGRFLDIGTPETYAAAAEFFSPSVP